MLHDSEMDIPSDTFCPKVIVPGWENMEIIPTVPNKGSGTISIVFQYKLTSFDIDMSHDFRVFGLINDIKN